MMMYVLGVGAGLLAGASGVAWWRGRAGWAMALLMGAALLLRLLMAGLDPFLHDWDERFHALVARNMMAHPGRPTLRADPLLPYDYQAWCCNHIWLHKQPLFLWQMALAMKLFGISTLAMRLPSIVLSTLVLWPVYRLGRLVFNDPLVGYLGALLAAFTYYQLELVSGAIGMDHDDIAFLVYVTGSIWAYYEYRASPRPTRWLVLVGVLAGAAVLCKWLTGLLVYAGWGLALLLQLRRGYRPLPEMARLLASLAVAVAVILPWQLYTARRFPVESAFERAYNTRHFTEALEGHGNVWYYHFELLPIHYGLVLGLVLLGIGLALRPARWRAALPLLAMVALIYLFFSLAATKMYSYTYVVSLLLLLLAALPLAAAARWLGRQASRWRWAPLVGGLGLAAVLAVDLRPWDIAAYHLNEETPYPEFMPESLNRKVREANAALYRQLGQEVPVGYTVFNAGVGTELEAMFFSGRNVYAGTPSEEEVRQLRARGVGLAVYGGHTQSLPGYLTAPGIVQLWGAAQ